MKFSEFSKYLKNNQFPYTEKFTKEVYFKAIEDFVFSETGYKYEDISSSSSYQPFETCKRLLKIYAPVLSEEVQRGEAQVRMLASLLLVSFFNILLALIAFLAYLHKGPSFILFSWLSVSIFIIWIIASTFRIRRYREVEDVYLCALIVCHIIERPGIY